MRKECCLYFLILSVLLVQCREKKAGTPEPASVTRSVNNNIIPQTREYFYDFFDSVYKATKDTANFFNFLSACTDSLERVDKKVNYPLACLAAYYHCDDNVLAAAKLSKEQVDEKFLIPILVCGIDSVEKEANSYLGADLYKNDHLLESFPYLNKWLYMGGRTGYKPESYKGYIYNIFANLHIRLGEYKLGYDLHKIAYELNITNDNIDDAAGNIVNISIILFDLKRNDSAINMIKRFNKYDDRLTELRKCFLNTELCRHYTMKGLLKDAEAVLENVMERVRKLKQIETDLERKKNSNPNEYKTKYIAALKQYADAVAAVREAGSLFYFSTEDYPKAIELLKDGLTISRTRGTGKALKMLGDCYLKLGREDTAMQFYQKSLYTVTNVDTNDIFSLPSIIDIRAENTIMEALDAKAELMMKWYQKTEKAQYARHALQCWELCFLVERKLMEMFTFDESRLMMLQESRARSEKAIATCYRLMQSEPDAKWAEKAFAIAEMNKAIVLLESVKHNNAALNGLQTDTAYHEIRSLKTELSFLEKEILENSISGKDTALPRLQKLQTEKNTRLAALQNNFSTTHPWYKKEMEKEDSFSLAMVRESLPDNRTGVVEYFAGDSVTYVFTFSKIGPLQLVKAAPNLAREVSSFLRFFTSSDAIINNRLAYRDSAVALFTALGIDSISRTSDQLLIIPDGPISFVPFEALVTTPGGDQLSNLAYLVKRCNISYGYSMATLLKQQTSDGDPVGQTAGFAPVFNNDHRGLPFLKNTPRELDVIKNIFPKGNFFRENEATLNNFRKYAASAGILHIATHAVGDSSRTSYAVGDTSRIHLPHIEFYDSTLWISELYALQLQASLVVLSACETGIGRIEKSEGPMSLARGFYYAGAKNIVTSLWSVDDKSTSALFTSFYKSLSGNNYGDALHKAKLQYINDAESDAQASPYYWAGFVHIGYEKRTSNANRWIWITGFASALAILAALLYSRKKGNKTKA